MNLLRLFLVSLFVYVPYCVQVDAVDTPNLNPNPAKVAAAENWVATNGCNVNVCFALDGSGSLSPNDFEAEKQFVALIAAIIGGARDPPKPGFAGTQYGLVNKNILKLTTKADKFVRRTLKQPFQNAGTTFMSAGIGFCFNELDDPELADDVNKIVVLGDGGANFGEGPFLPRNIVSQFLNFSPNNFVCGVAVPKSYKQQLANTLGIDISLVFDVPGFVDLLNVIDVLVEQICI